MRGERFGSFGIGSVAGVVVSVLCLLALFHFVDTGEILAQLGAIPSGVALAVVALVVVQNVLSGLRWLACLRALEGARASRGALRAHMYAIFAGQFLPGSVGVEVFKIGWARVTGLSIATAAISIVQEKAFALVAMAAMMAAALLWPGEPHPLVRAAGWGALAGLLALGVVCLILNGPMRARLPRFAARTVGPFLPGRGGGGRFATVFAFALAANVVILLVYALLWRALVGQPLDAGIVAAFVVIVLLTTLPLSFGGWGVRETAFVFFFRDTGAPSETLVSVGLAFGGFQIAGAVLGAAATALAHRRAGMVP